MKLQCSSPSEARVEQLIRSALRDFAAKLQESSTSLSSSSETEEKAEKKKRSSQCFFCKKFGHFKKDCRVYLAWLSKKQDSRSEDSEGHSGQSREGSTPRLLKKLVGHVAYQFICSDGQLDKIEVKEKQKYRTQAEERPLK